MKTRISIRGILVIIGLLIAFVAGAFLLSLADKTNEQSAKLHGFQQSGNSIYYYDKNGEMVTGWKEIKGSKFYFDTKTGAMLTGKHTIAGKEYTFSENGKLQASDSDQDKMDAKAAALASDTDYLILVNCKTHRVGIYKGSQNNWKRLYYWQCADGRKGHETPRAVYRMGTEKTNAYPFKYFDSEGGRLWYATKIWDVYLFHSVPYEIESEPNTVQDPTLGKSVSKGCIRLAIENAKWIYENIPQKTYCEIYDQ